MNTDKKIVSKVAAEACERVSRKVRLLLQQMRGDNLQFGGDSGLENVWDEICVQLQHQESVVWDAYDDTVRGLVHVEVKRLKRFEQEAIWLRTDSGIDWNIEHGEESNTPPVIESEITDFVMNNFLYRDADDWSNERIRAYLERQSEAS